MKSLAFLLALVMLCTLAAGCREEDTAAPDNTTTTTAAPTTAAPTLLSEEQALALATAHWDVQEGERDPETGFELSVGLMALPTDEAPYYVAVFRWLVVYEDAPSHYSNLDTIKIDAYTGAISPYAPQ